MTTATKPNKTKMFFLRTTEEERAKLDSLATQLGFGNASKLLRSRFPEVFPPSSTSTSRPKARRAPRRLMEVPELDEFLAERTGRPRALMRRAIAEGRVTLAGVAVREIKQKQGQVFEVDGKPRGWELDGKPV